MKQMNKGLKYKSLLTFLTIAFLQTIIWAQESGSSGTSTTTKSVSVTSESGDWYASPWVWVAGAAVFILLLVALLRGRGSDGTTASRTDRVTVTKSSTSDDLV
jgi:hypothetical protein